MYGCRVAGYHRCMDVWIIKLTPTTMDESAFEKLRCQVAQRS